MSDPTITRDILQAALDKAADRGDMAAFEHILGAMAGLATEVGQQPGQDRDLKATTALVAARPPRTFTYGDNTKAAIRAVTPKKMGGNRA